MGITKIAKLQRQLNEALDTARNATSALQTARLERGEARDAAAAARAEIASLKSDSALYSQSVLAEHQRQHAHIRRLFTSVFRLNLELARKGGYIDRVKETDAKGEPIIDPELGWPEEVNAEREKLAGARSETMVARVIDGMDTDVLDAVLGRDPDADYMRG